MYQCTDRQRGKGPAIARWAPACAGVTGVCSCVQCVCNAFGVRSFLLPKMSYSWSNGQTPPTRICRRALPCHIARRWAGSDLYVGWRSRAIPGCSVSRMETAQLDDPCKAPKFLDTGMHKITLPSRPAPHGRAAPAQACGSDVVAAANSGCSGP